jgi:type VI secretion system secreted protein Hcp
MAQLDMFLKIDGIQGESTDSKHTKEIEISAFHQGAYQHATTGSGTGGQGGGRVMFESIHFKAVTSIASPKLFLNCANGSHIATATFAMRKAGGTQQDFCTYAMKNVLVTSYKSAIGFDLESSGDSKTINWGDVSSGDNPAESVALQNCFDFFSLSFGSLEIGYGAQDKQGNVGAMVKGGWNAAENKPT